MNNVRDVLGISFQLPTLKDLALDCAARKICTCNPRLLPDQLTAPMRNELEEYKSDFGVKWLINQHEMCKKHYGVRSIVANLSVQKKAKIKEGLTA